MWTATLGGKIKPGNVNRSGFTTRRKSYFWQIFPHRPETQKLLNESDITKQATEKEKKILGESQSREEYKQKMEDALRRLQGVVRVTSF
jgi:hypothetical protein